MRTLFAGLLLMLAAAPCFSADFTVEASGKVTANDGRSRTGAPNVEFKVSADPLWGCKTQKELDRMAAKTQQDYPAVTITGGGKSDAQGEFSFQLKIEVPEGKKLPKASDGQNPPSWYDYVVVTVEATAEGYCSIRESWLLYVDKQNTARHVNLNRIARITGRLMSLSNMKPLADTTLSIRPRRLIQWKAQEEPPTWKVTTDARGNFEFNDPQGPVGSIELGLEDGSLAFASNSKVWAGLNVTHGDNDLGNLMVVAGCSLKLRVIESEEKKPVSVYINLHSIDGVLRIEEPARTGVFEKSGIPEGTYNLKIITGAYFGKDMSDLTLKAGVNDLGDIEVDPVLSIHIDVDVDQGQIPKHGMAYAYLLEGTPPAPPLVRSNSPYIKYMGNVHEKIGVISHLFKGRWFVVVESTGWAPVWTTVDLPMKEKLKVTLSQGGSFELSVSDPDGGLARIDRAGVAIIGTPAEKWLREVDARSFDDDNAPPGLLYGDHGTYPYKPGPLMPGKYLIRASSNVGMVEQEFEIKAGEHLKLNLTPASPRIDVTVTRDGKPASGEKLLFLSTDFMNRNTEVITEASSNSSGKCTFELKKPGQILVLLKREKEWVESAQYPYEKQQRKDAFSDRSFYIGYGTTVELNIDLGERTWLTLDVDLDKGWAVTQSQLTARLARSGNPGASATGVHNGSKIEFAMVRPGHYWLTLTLKDDAERFVSFDTALYVERKAEQTIKVKAALHSITVTVKLPKGAAEDKVFVTVVRKPQGLSNRPAFAGRFGSTAEGKRGKYTIEGVPEGDYYVFASLTGEDGRILYGSTDVEVSGNAKAKITINENQADLQLNIRAMQTGMLPQEMGSTAKVTLLDKDGKEVPIGFPSSAMGRLGALHLRGVPLGSHTLRVEATGCLTWQGEVTIRTGETARLNVDLEPAPMLRLTIDRRQASAVMTQDFTLKVEDAAGGALPGSEKDFDNLFFDPDQPALLITGLDQKAVRLRFKFKGFKEAIIELEPSTGGIHTRTLTLEAQ